jgi:hypothetical protein
VVGDPQSISEQSSGWYSSYGSWWGSRWGNNIVSQNVIQNAGLDDFTTEGGTAPGQIAVNARVMVTFELR